MAIVTLNPVFESMRGKIGNIVLYNNDSTLCARVKARPVNPDTEKQRSVRRNFGDAVRSWQSLTEEDKKRYNKKARRLSKKGYNLYISEYIKNNPAQTDIPGKAFTPYMKPIPGSIVSCTSVAGTLLSNYCLYSPDIQSLHV